MSWASILNSAWMGKCQPELWAFQRAARSVAKTQSAILKKILVQNRNTTFGRQYNFRGIRNPAEYQKRVPVTEYDSYIPYLERIAAGDQGVLTKSAVLLFEPTSGSTKGQKLVPYTSPLRKQFQRGVAAWIANLFRHRPRVRHGRAYWSISPALGSRKRTVGGIPIGFDDDTAYLGAFERRFVSRLLAVPPHLVQQAEIQNFRYTTLGHLLLARDLSLISIWSPTFLTSLLSSLEEWTSRLLYDFRRGCFSLPLPPGENSSQSPPIPTGPNCHQVSHLKSILESKESLPEKLQRIWPQLALISCWTDASAGEYLGKLQQLFPSIEIQPKGLLATEGFVSFPLVGKPGAAVALRSHFFEFVEEPPAARDPNRESHVLAHELEQGGNYRVLLTTAGGFYRYELHDRIQVVGFHQDCPLVRFLGKTNLVSDLVGEKLNEAHVREVLRRVFTQHGMSPTFALLVPINESPPRYHLYLQDAKAAKASDLAAKIAWEVEEGLKENPYYSQAMQLSQLSRLKVVFLKHSEISAWAIYERGCNARGQKVGDIKPIALDPRPFWDRDFSPIIMESS